MKKVLVTGGTGFLGRAIIKMLLAENVSVNVLCRKNFSDLEDAGCTVFAGEISDENLVTKACEGCDTVFHTAAKAGIEEPYSEYLRINYDGTINVIKACKANKVMRLVYTVLRAWFFLKAIFAEKTNRCPTLPRMKPITQKPSAWPNKRY